MVKENVGSYCYEIALSKVKYSPNAQFSPNNIKRLVISGDGIIVTNHVSVPGVQQTRVVFFNFVKTRNCFNDANFKPIVASLVDLVCSNIEEIVFCLDSALGVKLSNKELSLNVLMKGYTGVMNPQSEADLLGRFVRLRSITFVNNRISDIEVLLKSEEFAKGGLVADCSKVSLSKVIKLDNDTWFSNWRLRPQHYALDVKDGSLDKHFKAIDKAFKELVKSSKIRDLNKSRLSEKIEKLSSDISFFSKMYIRANTLYSTLKNASTVGVPDEDYLPSIERLRVALADVMSGISDFRGYSLDVDLPSNVTKLLDLSSSKLPEEKDKSKMYDLVSDMFSSVAIGIYKAVLTWFVAEIVARGKKFPTTMSIKLKDFPSEEVLLPAELLSIVQQFNLTFNKSIRLGNGAVPRKSLSWICYYSVFILVPLSVATNNEVFDVSYWLNLDRG